MKRFNFIFCLFAVVTNFISSDIANAQSSAIPMVQGTLHMSVAGVNAVSFSCAIKDAGKGQSGEMYMDTSNLWYNDRKVPIPANVMNALKVCEPLNFGEVVVVPLEGETHEQATTRIVTDMFTKHIKDCFKRGLIAIGVRIIPSLL